MPRTTSVMIATSRGAVDAADRLRTTYAAQAEVVETHVRTLAEATSGEAARDARDALVAWARETLLPHLEATGPMLDAAGRVPEAALVAEAVDTLQRRVVSLVDALEGASRPAAAVAAASALEAVLDVRRHHVDALVVPALVQAPGIDLAALVTPALAQ
jgi:hypothetical protein